MLPWLHISQNYPLSGNVHQNIEPDWFFNSISSEAGDAEIEKEVFFNVASYGRQIGMLMDVLLALADELKMDRKDFQPLAELREIQARVESVKASRKNRVRENARKILDKMKAYDREGLESLLREYGDNR